MDGLMEDSRIIIVRPQLDQFYLSDKERAALEYARNACFIMATPLGCGDGGRAYEYARVITALLKRVATQDSKASDQAPLGTDRPGW